jgi:hypothetical protein
MTSRSDSIPNVTGDLLRRNSGVFEHVAHFAFEGGEGGGVGGFGFEAGVEAVPDGVPVATGGALGIFGGALFEEVRVFHAVEQRGEPGEGVFLDHVDRLEAQLAQAPIGDVADVALDVLGGHAGDGALLEGEVDKGVFEADGFLAAVDNVFLDRFGQAATLLDKGVEEFGDAFAVERFVADGPADDLAHALHLVEPGEVHQHGEGGEELQPFGEAAEHGQRAGDVFVIIDPEGGHVVVLGLHFLIFEEHAIFAFGHADGVEQVRIGGDVDRFHVGKRGQHHLDLGGLEHAAVFFVVAILHFHVGLGEEAEDLGEQVALVIGELLRPIATIFAQRHFLGQPVDLLLQLPVVIGPGVFEGLVGFAGFEKRHGVWTPDSALIYGPVAGGGWRKA